MITHIDIANKIIFFLDSIYYQNLSKLYSKNKENTLFSGELSSKENTMNLSNNLSVDKELFSGERSSKENTMNLSKNLSVDKELFSGERSSKENTMNLSKNLSVDKELFSGERSSKENTLNEIFQVSKFPIFKPDYFVFQQYYLIYSFMYHISYRNTIRYSISLQLFHVFGIIYDNLLIKYDYKPIHNINYLKNIAYILFIYLFWLKISFMNVRLFKKILLLSIFSTFYMLVNINEIYKQRLKCIENNEIFIHPLKILVLTPNKNIIQNIIKKTNIFTYGNFLLCINLFVYLLL